MPQMYADLASWTQAFFQALPLWLAAAVGLGIGLGMFSDAA